MTVLVWPNIDIIIETLLVATLIYCDSVSGQNIDIIIETLLLAILIYCEVSIHYVIKCQTTMATFPLRYQLDLNVVRGWQQLGFLCPIWLTELEV